MTVSSTIDLGNILALVGMLITVVTFGASLKASIQHLDGRVAKLETKIDTQSSVLIELAKFEGRLYFLEQQFLPETRMKLRSNIVPRT